MVAVNNAELGTLGAVNETAARAEIGSATIDCASREPDYMWRATRWAPSNASNSASAATAERAVRTTAA